MKPPRNADSAPGDWYVDTACIDCGASRHVAPGLVVEQNGKSVFARQPTTPEEHMAAWRARLDEMRDLALTRPRAPEILLDARAGVLPKRDAEAGEGPTVPHHRLIREHGALRRQ